MFVNEIFNPERTKQMIMNKNPKGSLYNFFQVTKNLMVLIIEPLKRVLYKTF